MVIMAMTVLSCNLSTSAVEPPPPTIANSATPENTATEPLPPTFPPPMEPPTSTPAPTETPTETPTLTVVPPTMTYTSTLLSYDPNATPTPPPTIPSGYVAPRSQNNTAIYLSPTSNSVPPTARPSHGITAVLFSPTIDGDWGEWPNAEVTSGYVVFGNANWTSDNDLNSSVKTAYDSNYLYVAVKVIDDLYVQKATGYQIYLGDSLEILLDSDLTGDYSIKNLNDDDFQLGISGGLESIDGEKEAYLWYPQNIKGKRDQVAIASQRIDAGYMVEAAIPWSLFSITPASGKHYGFAVSVSDNDNHGILVQESMVSNVSTRKFLNPTTWGDLVLE